MKNILHIISDFLEDNRIIYNSIVIVLSIVLAFKISSSNNDYLVWSTIVVCSGVIAARYTKYIWPERENEN